MERPGRRLLSIGLAVVLLLAVGVAVYRSLGGGGETTVRGLIGSEKLAFFQDPAVVDAFASHGLQVEVETAGSREIAITDRLGEYDFGFPAGVPAADRIRADHGIDAAYEPFFSPMAVATFTTIADVLRAAGVAEPLGEGHYLLDLSGFLDLVAEDARWSDLPGNTAYAADKSVLISSTNAATSNSGAMYVALASYVLNGNRVVSSPAEGDAVLDRVADLFLRQGYVPNSTADPFTDYLSIGIGKAPMALIYEAQFLEAAARGGGALAGDMVLMYPDPTTFARHTLVPLTEAGDRVGRLLTEDPELQRLAVTHGFRTTDPGAMAEHLAAAGVPAPPELVDVIEPPTHDNLEHMIVGIEQRS